MSYLALMIWDWCLPEEYHHLRRAHSWSGQRRSRPGIEEENWACRMDAQQRYIQEGGGVLWRWISLQPGTTTDTTVGDRCPSSVMEGTKAVRLPTFQSSRKMPQKDKTGESTISSSDCSSVAGPIIVDLPVLLPHSPHILVNPTGQVHPLVRSNSHRSAAWRVSGNPSKIEEFQRKLSTFYPRHGDHPPRSHILQRGRSGWAGVLKGSWIPFQLV